MFTLNWTNVKSAIIYGLLMGGLALLDYLMKLPLTPTVLAILGLLASVLKNLLTSDSGHFLGMVRVIPNNK